MNPSLRLLAPLALVATAPFAAAQLTAVRVATGLSQPDGLFASPTDPGLLYVTQKTGQVQTVRNGAVTGTAADVSGLIATDGERGLLGMAFAPDYATSGKVYLSYVDNASKALRVVRTTNFNLSTAQTIIDLPHADFNNHYGGNITFGPDGKLYVGIGDGGSGNDPNNNAQNLNVLLGKLLRLDVSGSNAGYAIPSDNPFAAPNSGGRGEVWAYGLRNPFKYSFDRNDLYIADVGQDAYEEIDQAIGNPGGRNYGWRVREGLHDNGANNDPLPTNLTDPIYEYGHSQGQSITGGFVYRGTALGSAYVGRYFFGDYVKGRLWSIDPANPNGSLQEYTAGLGVSGNISSIDRDANGEIVVTYFGGSAYRLQAVPEPGTWAALGLGALVLVRRKRRA